VIKAKHKHTGQMRALKQIPKSKLKEPERLKTEIEILKTLVIDFPLNPRILTKGKIL